jgi:hypothetical protein
MKQNADNLMSKIGRSWLQLTVCSTVLLGQVSTGLAQAAAPPARRPLYANQATLNIGSKRPSQRSSRRQWSAETPLRRTASSITRNPHFRGTAPLSRGFKEMGFKESGSRPAAARQPVAPRQSPRQSVAGGKPPRQTVAPEPITMPRPSFAARQVGTDRPERQAEPTREPTVLSTASSAGSSGLTNPTPFEEPGPVNQLRAGEPGPQNEAKSQIKYGPASADDWEAAPESSRNAPEYREPTARLRPLAPLRPAQDSAPRLESDQAQESPAIEVQAPELPTLESPLSDAPANEPVIRELPDRESLFSKPSLREEPIREPELREPLREPANTDQLETDAVLAPPEPDSQELTEARGLLQLLDTLGMKSGKMTTLSQRRNLSEPRPWSTADSPVQPVDNGDLYERDPAWQTPGADWNSTSSSPSLDRLVITQSDELPAVTEHELSQAQSGLPNPLAVQNALRETDDPTEKDGLTSGFNTSLTSPNALGTASHFAETVSPPSLISLVKPQDFPVDQRAEEMEGPFDVKTSDTPATHLSSQPAPSALADLNDEDGVTARVFDDGPSVAENNGDDAPLSDSALGEDLAAEQPEVLPNWQEITEPAATETTEAESVTGESPTDKFATDGRAVRDHLKSAIDRLVGGQPDKPALSSIPAPPVEVRPRSNSVTTSRPQLPRQVRPNPVPPQHWEDSTIRSTVPSPVGTAERPNGRRPAEIRLAARTSYPLQAPGRVARVTVVDRSICEVVQRSPYELALVGKQEGQTGVSVWLEGQRTPQVYRIVVGRGGTTAPDKGKLDRLLAELFPDSQVRISQRNGAMHVDGNARNRQEAIQILSVVRSIKLVAVVDNLQVIRY